MKLFRSSASMQKWSLAQRRRGKRLGFVPTMGSLHAGHLKLVDVARQNADVVVVSIFVNPIQFNNPNDLKKYPRDEKGDLKMLRKRGVDAVFLPGMKDIYPHGFQTRVLVSEVTKPLCGASRPGHFTGVTTVVMKLLQIVQPTVACFGLKDYQQYIVVRTMVLDLCLPIKIIGVPTVRESDGLAMSSRNKRLSSAERELALGISRGLKLVAAACRRHRLSLARMRAIFLSCLSRDKSVRLDYISCLDAVSLRRLSNPVPGRTLMAVAVWVGDVRLIDNRIF